MDAGVRAADIAVITPYNLQVCVRVTPHRRGRRRGWLTGSGGRELQGATDLVTTASRAQMASAGAPSVCPWRCLPHPVPGSHWLPVSANCRACSRGQAASGWPPSTRSWGGLSHGVPTGALAWSLQSGSGWPTPELVAVASCQVLAPSRVSSLARGTPQGWVSPEASWGRSGAPPGEGCGGQQTP